MGNQVSSCEVTSHHIIQHTATSETPTARLVCPEYGGPRSAKIGQFDLRQG